MISKEIFYKFCEEGEFSKIKLFYKYMNLTDDEKYLAFAISIDNQNMDIIKFFINEKVKIHMKNNDNIYPLIFAAANCNYKIFKLLEKLVDIKKISEENSIYPLSHAIRFGNYKIVKLLLKRDILIDYDEHFDINPICSAVKYNQLKILKSIINNPNFCFDSEIECVYINETTEINDILDNKLCPLCIAAKYGNYKIVKYLINNNHIKHEINNVDFLPLCFASKFNKIKIVKYFIKLDKSSLESYDNYALRIACKNGNYKIVKFLINNGANILTNDNYCLRISCKNGWFKIVKLLIREGVDINCKFNNPILLASRYGHCNIIKLLIKKGAQVNYGDYPPIYYSIKNGYTNSTKILLKNNAEIPSVVDNLIENLCTRKLIKTLKLLIKNNYNLKCISNEIRINLDLFEYPDKDNKINFRKYDICPITLEKFKNNTKKLGCSKCLNIFSKNELIKWMKYKNICPYKCKNNKFYLIKNS